MTDQTSVQAPKCAAKTYYMIEWLLPNNEVRYNRAELYETREAADTSARATRDAAGAKFAPLMRRWMVNADYRIAVVQIRTRVVV